MQTHFLKFPKGFLVLLFFAVISVKCVAQDSYEIQVYGSEPTEKGKTMLEFHTNFTANGNKAIENGVVPSHHSLHESIELTHGFSSWFEIGLYLFTSASPSDGYSWVGNHIRPRFSIPKSWNWPVGLSLSNEFGYIQRSYSADTWDWELRPIIDKTFFDKLYVSFNPTLEKSLKGVNINQGFVFSPNFKMSYRTISKAAFGVEYYGVLGPLHQFDTYQNQEHQIVPCVDLYLSPDWEFNMGAMFGVTNVTDKLVFKLIVGRRF